MAAGLFKMQDFSLEQVQGYRAVRPHVLVKEHELPDGVKFSDLISRGFVVEKLTDEKGAHHTGILIPSGPRTWEVYGEVHDRMAEHIHHHGGQLRRDQGKEVCTWYRGDLSKVNPRGTDTVENHTDFLKLCQDVVTEKEVAKAASAMAEPVVPKPPPPQEPGESSDEAVAVDDEEEFQPLTGPSAALRKKKDQKKLNDKKNVKAKRKAEEKAKSRGKGFSTLASKKPPSFVASAQGSTVPSSLGVSTAGGDDASSASGRSNPESVEAQLQFHLNSLSIHGMLSGKAMGREKWHATNFMNKHKDTVAGVLMKGHLDLYQAASRLLPSDVAKTTEQERQKIFTDLKAANLSLPPHVRPGILTTHLKSLSLEARVPRLNPFEKLPEGDFLAGSPSLSQCCVGETEKGRLLQKCLISDAILPAICSGEPKVLEVQATAKAVLQLWEGHDTESLGAMLAVSAEEVRTVCLALWGLIGANKANEETQSAVNDLYNAKVGSKMIVMKADLKKKTTFRAHV